MIASYIESWARRRQDSVALVSRLPGRDHFESTTYGELRRRIHLASNCITEAIRADTTIALRMSSDASSVAGLLGAERAGFSTLMLPAGIPSTEEEAILRTAGINVIYDAVSNQVVRTATGIEAANSTPRVLPAQAVCQLTSGTTGRSHIAVRTVEGISKELAAIAARLEMEVGESVLTVSSIAHSYGLFGGTLAPLTTGGQVILAPDHVSLARMGADMRPAGVFGLGGTYRSLMTSGAEHEWLRLTRYVLTAGAPLPAGLAEAFKSWSGVSINQDYGTTETGTIAIETLPNSVESCVGKPLDHNIVRLSASNMFPRERGDLGEIIVQSAAVAIGYLESDSVLRGAVDSENWFHTRDAGWFDSSGHLYVGQRLREAISISDLTVHPDVIEEALRRVPGVQDVVAFPIVRDTTTRVKAVVAAPGESAQRIKQACLNAMPNLASYIDVEVRDLLPKSPAGKILQKYLR